MKPKKKTKPLLAAFALAGALTTACVPTCLARGTWVKTLRGKKRIEELQFEDEIVAFDIEQCTLVETRVTHIVKSMKPCFEMASKTTTLRLTDEHPLYCPVERDWFKAVEWRLGARRSWLEFFGASTDPSPIVSVIQNIGVLEVFDIGVESELHNFVANDVLVHNKSIVLTCGTAADGGTVRYGENCELPDGGTGLVNLDCSCEGKK